MNSLEVVSTSRLLALGAALCLACGGAPAKPAAPAPVTPTGTAPPIAPLNASAATDNAITPPPSFGPLNWHVLGPLPNPLAGDGKARTGMASDLLASLGGEARATIGPNTSLTITSQSFVAKPASADPAGIVDLLPLYQGNTELKVAYAYAEFDSPEAGTALAVVGSDDSVAVWINGKEVHRNVTDRPIKVGEDHFTVPLLKGRNRILLKVDNGGGGWAFAISFYDAAAQRKLEALALRRHLEEIEVLPTDGTFFLKAAFPKLALVHPRGANTVLGEPHVRWFDPSLAEVDRPEREGRYVALVEAPSGDGHTYRRLVTFAKLAKERILPWVPFEPFGLPPVVELPWGRPLPRAAQQELSRQVWRATQKAWETEGGAITALALSVLDPKRPATQQLPWFETGFFRDLEHKLALRLKLEGRQPKAFAPPAVLATPAGTLRTGSEAEAGMKPGTVQKLRAGLTFTRAVEQGLVGFDQPLSSVFPGYANDDATRTLTFRQCFYHLSGLQEHYSHGGLLDPFLDNDFLVQDFPFKAPGTRFLYNGDDINLAMMALSVSTGRSVPRLYNEHLQTPFDEPVVQLDGGTSGMFTATYLAKVGQMLLQDGKYGRHQFYSPGFLAQIMPKKAADYAPGLEDKQLESGIGLSFMPDPDGPREKGVLGANVIGHGSGAGVYWRVAFEHQLVAVVGRNDFDNWQANEAWGDRLAALLAENIRR